MTRDEKVDAAAIKAMELDEWAEWAAKNDPRIPEADRENLLRGSKILRERRLRRGTLGSSEDSRADLARKRKRLQIMLGLDVEWLLQWELITIYTCLAVTVASNFLRHDATRIPRTAFPRHAYLTVHTIFIELVYAVVNLIDCTLRSFKLHRPRLIVKAAHSLDALVMAIGTLLCLAYYTMVHAEIRATQNNDYIRYNNVIHAPTAVMPFVITAAKPPSLLRDHGLGRFQILAAALVYSGLYVSHVERCAALAPDGEVPYNFMRKLKAPKQKVLFWCGGSCLGLLITVFAYELRERCARTQPKSWFRRHCTLLLLLYAFAFIPWATPFTTLFNSVLDNFAFDA